MQSLAVYGRFVVRAVLTELASEFQATLPWYGPLGGLSTLQPSRRAFHLATAVSGRSKTHSSHLSTHKLLKPTSFGDDACFVAQHELGDVLGKLLFCDLLTHRGRVRRNKTVDFKGLCRITVQRCWWELVPSHEPLPFGLTAWIPVTYISLGFRVYHSRRY